MPTNPSQNLELAREKLALGHLADAETLLAASPPSHESSVLRAILLLKLGKAQEAEPLLAEAHQKNRNEPEAARWLASARVALSRWAEALPVLETALAAQPNEPELLNLWGNCLLKLGRPADAAHAFRRLIPLVPTSPVPHANLGMALRLQNRGEDALAAFQEAVRLGPDQPQNHLQLFKQFQQLSRWPQALAALQQGLQAHPQSADLKEALALTCARLGRTAEAESLFIEIAPLGTTFANAYAAWLQEQGRFADSIPVLESSIRLKPLQGVAWHALTEARQFNFQGQPVSELTRKMRNEPGISPTERMRLLYALATSLDHEAAFAEAAEAFDRANELAYDLFPACRTFDPAWCAREPRVAAEIYSGSFLSGAASLNSSSSQPIWIVGMIRSGTTLLDRVLAAHPLTCSVGEQPFWNATADALHPRWRGSAPTARQLANLARRYVEAVPGLDPSTRWIDKMPLNYRNLGPILSAFPRSKILHIRRNPLDTVLSIYTTYFAGGPNFAYSQPNIVAFYRSYQSHMDHWRHVLAADQLYELDYESLVQEPETQIRRLLEFLGLPWDPACLQPNALPGVIVTPSRWQARQPFYSRSIGRADRYRPFLRELVDLAD